jgi:4-amino-4-deoxy-L-arabinose transferase-like glycosyltransferase
MEKRAFTSRVEALVSSPGGFLLFLLVLYSLNLWRGFYIDEYLTWRTTGDTLSHLVQERLRAGHLPAYFLTTWALTPLLGSSEVALRLPSVLFCLGAVFAFRRLTRELLPQPTASLATFFFGLHQLTIWSAQTARPYAPLLCFSLLAALCLVFWWREGHGRWLVGLIVLLLVGTTFQALTALVALAFVTTLLCAQRSNPRRAWTAIGSIALVALALALPVCLLGQEQHNYAVGDAFSFPLKKGLNGLAHIFYGDYAFVWDRGFFKHLFTVLMVVTILGGWRWLSQRRSEQPDGNFPLRVFLFNWAFVPWLGLILVAGIGGDKTLAHERYYTVCLAPLVVLLTLGVEYYTQRLQERPRWRPVPMILSTVLIVACSVGWLVQRGDGPKILARRMDGPRVFVGATLPLRHDISDPNAVFVDLSEKSLESLEEATRELSSLAERYDALWLVVYNNKKDLLDPLIENPPSPWRIVKKEEYHDARAVLLARSPR